MASDSSKALVLKVHPRAVAEPLNRELYRGPRGGRYEWSIRVGTEFAYLGYGDTEAAAWDDAATDALVAAAGEGSTRAE